MAAASADAASILGQVVLAIGTVVAAILGAVITGFWAAGLKHKWDTEADEKRLRQERAARDRAQRLDAFAEYLDARPDLAAVTAIVRKEKSAAAVASPAQLAAARLLILLPDADQHAIVKDDLDQMMKWVAAWTAPSTEGHTGVPSLEPILGLARALVIESYDGGPGR